MSTAASRVRPQDRRQTVRALVLGGGGVAGIAWTFGLLAGLHRHGLEIADADVIIGTSAGAYVGALIATGTDPAEAAAAGRDLSALAPHVDLAVLAQVFATMSDNTRSPTQMRKELGRLARAAAVGPALTSVPRFAERLAGRAWPTQPRLVVTAVHTGTGRPVAWDASDGVPLAAAVAASCAVPGVFPPERVGDAGLFMDGGVRSVTNADLAAGADAVVVVAPTVGTVRGTPHDELQALGRARIVLLAPDPAAQADIGPNSHDPGRWTTSLRAGGAQAAAQVAAVREVWRR